VIVVVLLLLVLIFVALFVLVLILIFCSCSCSYFVALVAVLIVYLAVVLVFVLVAALFLVPPVVFCINYNEITRFTEVIANYTSAQPEDLGTSGHCRRFKHCCSLDILGNTLFIV
jgi:hypothetical protein